jgi:hypothetical protein
VRNLARDYPEALFLELGPGTVLSNLTRRIVPDAQVMSCGTADDVEKLLQRVS